MSSLPQVCAALQLVFTTVATRLAHTSTFIRRQRQLTGSGLVQGLVFGFLANPQATVEQLAQSLANSGCPISPQGLDQRFTETAATYLHDVLAAAVQQVIAAKAVAVPILQRFQGVFVLDSTTIALPDSLAHRWRGCGGSPTGSAAAVKVQVLWNLTTGALQHIGMSDGRASDQRASVQDIVLPVGALQIADLGYFALDQIAAMQAAGSFVLSRWFVNTALFTPAGEPLDLVQLLRTHAQPTLDWDVRIGQTQQLAVRLLATQVPQEVADQRRRRLRAEARHKGRTVSPVRLALADWTIGITTVPRAQLTVAEALVLLRTRWQVELLFKLWKSQGRVDKSRSQQPWRILCEVYAKLLAMLVLHWVLLVSCWSYADRSLVKATHTLQAHALALAAAVATASGVAAVLTRIARCIGTGCRLNRRRKHPNTYQLLLALTDEPLT